MDSWEQFNSNMRNLTAFRKSLLKSSSHQRVPKQVCLCTTKLEKGIDWKTPKEGNPERKPLPQSTKDKILQKRHYHNSLSMLLEGTDRQTALERKEPLTWVKKMPVSRLIQQIPIVGWNSTFPFIGGSKTNFQGDCFQACWIWTLFWEATVWIISYKESFVAYCKEDKDDSSQNC